MQDKLKKLEELLEEKQAQLADPAVYADPAKLKKLNREVKDLEPKSEENP